MTHRILAQSLSARFARPRHRLAAGVVAVIGSFSMMAALGTAPTTLEIHTERRDLTLALPAPEAVPLPAPDDALFVREERIQRGDTAASLLARLGIEDTASLDFLRHNARTAEIFRQLAPGKTVVARTDRNGVLYSLTFPLNGGRQEMLTVSRDDNGSLNAERRSLALENHLVLASAEIRSSLFAATDAAGIPDAIAVALTDIFGSEIDFHRDLRRGDRLTVVYESASHLGRPLQHGRVLAAEFINNGHRHQAIWFGEGSHGGYYTADGQNLRKAFLRSPLEFSRITSGFTNARFHPVLNVWRAHQGVDYAAPPGTRVRATGDGIVDLASFQRGYGNVVILQHRGQYSTLYAHLSGFAPGLRKGSRVSQGDVIGYVGATGLASGPHLHYEFRVAGEHRDPLNIALPSAPPLEGRQREAFRQHAEGMIERLALAKATEVALAD